MNLQQNIPLAPLTTFKVGGPARFFVDASTHDEVLEAVSYAREQNLRLFVLGGGSNLVVSDAGWPGLVLKIGIKGVVESQSADGQRVFEVGAGEEWDTLVAQSVARNCAGMETLSGIPGTVGGTPVQNVGAYGQEVSETITNVQVLDLSNMHIRDLSNAECGFTYRTSIFNTRDKGRYVVLKVSYALLPNGAADIVYADLKKYFANTTGPPSLSAVRSAVREIRLSKAMLIVPNDDDCRSAGSFFKNPIVTQTKCDEVSRIAAKNGVDREPPRYSAKDGLVKMSAAWLVEQSGFRKGTQRGPVAISRRHSLAIVNRGGASAADILQLKKEIQLGVCETFGIDLHPEPVFVGFDESAEV